MSEMIGEFPALHQTIVAERDIYLTHTLRQAARCVETPHNAQSNCFTCSNHKWRLYFLSAVFFCLSICKQDTKTMDTGKLVSEKELGPTYTL